MLNNIHEIVAKYSSNLYLEDLFSDILFRSALAILLSFIVSLMIGNRVILFLKSVQKNGQPIRDDGPESHLAKSGTPTMGGVIIILGTLISTLTLADLYNPSIWIVLFVMLSFAVIGGMDDYQKISKNNHLGISAKAKMIYQILISLVAFSAISYYLPSEYNTQISFPFVKNIALELSYAYIPFLMIVISGSSNAVNLTDGLDGLASGSIAIAFSAFAIIAYLVGNSIFANYIQIIHVEFVSELSVFCCAIVGSCLGFLWFNSKPAEIFMGDTGSLSLGATLGIVSVITKNEFTLVIIGGVFVIETLSVIMQVLYFKLSGGKRVFLMAPIHHHFEQKGYSESKIVIRFWIVSLLLAIIGLISLVL